MSTQAEAAVIEVQQQVPPPQQSSKKTAKKAATKAAIAESAVSAQKKRKAPSVTEVDRRRKSILREVVSGFEELVRVATEDAERSGCSGDSLHGAVIEALTKGRRLVLNALTGLIRPVK